jgi:hypothetical protein
MLIFDRASVPIVVICNRCERTIIDGAPRSLLYRIEDKLSWKRAGQIVAGAGIAVAALTAIAQPALAASDPVTVSIANGTGKAQVDNSPANGGASWIWAWADKSLKYSDAEFYKEGDGRVYSFSVFSGQSASKTLDKNVTAVRICVEHKAYAGRTCGGWAHPAY